MNFNYQKILGYDVSFYQDDNTTPQKIDFNKMKAYGASFVIVRAGQYKYKDEDFDYNWYESAKAGIPRSSYWFGDKDDTGKAQARKHWSLIRNDVGEGPHFIDYEGGSWTDWNQLFNFISEFQQLSGSPNSKIGIYTGYYYWLKYSPANLSIRDWFKKYNLWLAWYSEDPAYVKVPHPWTDENLLLWQQGTPKIGIAAGAESKEIDLDLFNGDSDRFKFYWGTNPTEPPTGEDMVLYFADLKSGLTSNVRSSAGLSAPVTKQLTGPLTVSITSEKVVKDGYDWYQISLPVAGYIAYTSSYTNFRSASVTNDPPVKVTVQTASGKVYVATNLVEQ